jgi:hypothetical protein
LWDDVQAVLATNRVERGTGARGKHPSLLTGMVFDETGERLSARQKSKPRNGAGEIFMTAAAEIARETVSARIALEHGTANPRKFATKWAS